MLAQENTQWIKCHYTLLDDIVSGMHAQTGSLRNLRWIKLTLFIAIQFIGPHRKQDADIAESERIIENAGFIAAPRV